MLIKLLKHYWRPYIAIILIFTIVGISFIFTSQTSEQMKIQTYQELDQQWRTDYDLLIRPNVDQSHSIIENELVRRSDMGDIRGGISLEQYEQIKQMDGVQVAAPLSFLGYIGAESPNSKIQPDEGFYVEDIITEVFDGIRYRDVPNNHAYSVSDIIHIQSKFELNPSLSGLYRELGWTRNAFIGIPVRDDYYWSIIAVDPDEESKLIELNSAIIEGEYLPVQKDLFQTRGYPVFPIILHKKEFEVHRTVHIGKVINEELSTYLSNPLEHQEELLEFNKRNNIRELPRETMVDIQYKPYSSDLIYFFGSMEVGDGTLEKGYVSPSIVHPNVHVYDLGPLNHDLLGELDGNPLFEAIPLRTHGEQINYRGLDVSLSNRGFSYDIYGIFDSTLLHNPYSTNSEPKSPDFYNPDKVYYTHDVQGNPLPERIEYQSPPSKEGYSTGGVDAITTLGAAEYLLGDKPISIIRVVVDGVGERSPESMAKVERIAEQIRQEMGLLVDVMLGAADRKVQVLLDDYEGVPGYGYLLEGWSQAGASFVIEDRVNNTNLLLSGYTFIIGLLGVFLVYRNFAEVRKKDLIIQYTFGWRKSRIYKQLVNETALTVLIVTLILMISKYSFGNSWSWEQFGVGATLTLIIVLLSIFFFYIVPVTNGIEKQINLRTSGQVILPIRIQSPSGSLWGYLWHTMIRYAMRSFLKFAILLATLIFVLLFLITKGNSSNFLTLTFLGENIDLMLEPYQWVLFGFGVVLSLGSYIAIQMNQIEKRTQEIQLFQAWGWKIRRWMQLYIIEELFIVMLALAIGIGGGYWLLHSFALTDEITGTSLILLIMATIVFSIVILTLTLFTSSKQNRLREFN